MYRHTLLFQPFQLFLGVLVVLVGAIGAPAIARAQEHAHEHEHEHDPHDDVEQIVITASPLAHERDELAIAVERLDREEITRAAAATLGEALAGRPGIAASSFAPGASRPVVRGQGAFRVQVLEGGLGMQGASTLSPDHGVPLNPLTAQSIEVVRGPATLRYGGGAIAGAVNAITNRVPVAREDALVHGEIFGSYGENANERDLAVLLEGGRDAFAWHFDALARDADDYETGAGERQRGSATDARAFSAGASWFPDWGRIGFAFARFENEYGIPEEGEAVDIDLRVNRYRFEADWIPSREQRALLREVRVRGVFSDYTHDEIADGAVGQSYDNREFEGRVEALHEEWRGFRGAAGLQIVYRDLEAGGEAAEFLAPSETTSVGAYVFEERELHERVSVEAGLRAEYSEVEGRARGGTRRTQRFVPISGSLGVLVDPLEGIGVGLMAAISQRAPSQVELFARGPHEATSTFEIGDPDFDEETSYSAELTLRGERGRWRFESSHFVTWYEDFIFGQLTGIKVDEAGAPSAAADALDELRYGARNALFYGAEVSLGFQLYQSAQLEVGVDASFDWVRGRFTNGSDLNIPRTTPIRWGGGVSATLGRSSARIGFQRVEAQEQLALGETRTGDFTLVDLVLSYEVTAPEAERGVTLILNARNLADVRGRNHVAFNKEEVLIQGRSFRVGLRGRF